MTRDTYSCFLVVVLLVELKVRRSNPKMLYALDVTLDICWCQERSDETRIPRSF